MAHFKHKELAVILVLSSLMLLTRLAQAQSSEIKIGAILPLTGAAAGIGKALEGGLRLAVKDFNQQEMGSGKRFNLIVEDTGSEVKNAVAAFQKLVAQDKVKYFFTILSSHAMALKPLVEREKVLLFADVTHPDITKDSRFIIRHSNLAELDAEKLAQAILQASPNRVGILYRLDDWGSAMEAGLRAKLAAAGVRVVSQSHLPAETDFKPLVSRLGLESLDAIAPISLGAPLGQIIRELRAHKYPGGIYSSVGMVLTPDAKAVGAEGLRGVFYQTYERNLAFEKHYRDEYGEEAPILGQIGYTDVELLAQALRQSGSPEPGAVSTYIRGLKSFQGSFEKVEVRSSGDIPVATVMARFE
jgi:branched-chain amino acid transport system substrate-binding protein